MPSYLELLPDAILRHELFPLLDHQGRETVNACLPSSYYIRTKLNPKKLLQSDILYASNILNKSLSGINTPPSIKKRDAIKTLVTEVLPKCLIVARYKSKFRTVLLLRILDISNEDNPAYTDHPDIYTPEYKKEIITACTKIINELESYYSYAIEVPIVPVAVSIVSS